MGQKVNPIGFRLGVIRSWDSKWYEEKNYAKWLHEDIKLREYVKKKLGQAGISRVEIERAASKVKINVHTARPGIVIGKRGAGIEQIKKELQAFTQNEVFLNIVEVRKAEVDAQLVAEAKTTYGKIGCKVWIFRGEVLPEGVATVPEKGSIGPSRPTRPLPPRASQTTPTPVQ